MRAGGQECAPPFILVLNSDSEEHAPLSHFMKVESVVSPPPSPPLPCGLQVTRCTRRRGGVERTCGNAPFFDPNPIQISCLYFWHK